MRNAKKLLAFLLATVILLSTFVPALASENAETGLPILTSKPVDIALAVGNSTLDFSNFEKNLRDALSAINKDGKGTINPDDINISGIDATSVGTTGNFQWLEFDHSNDSGIYNSASYPYVDYTNTQKSNTAYDQKDRHTVVEDNGTKMTFYGYSQSAYSDFMLLEHDQNTKKEFTFALKEYFAADALAGMGFFVNADLSYSTGLYLSKELAYASSALYLNGYLVFMDYDGKAGEGIIIYKVSNLNLKSFHNGSVSVGDEANFSEVASVGTEVYDPGDDLRKFRIVAKPSTIEVFYEGFDDDTHGQVEVSNEASAPAFDPNDPGYQAFTNTSYSELSPVKFGLSTVVALDSTHGGAGFGPMVKFDGHNCARLTKVELSELAMSMDVVRSLVDVVREPTWREDTDRFIVYINDTKIDDFTDESSTGEILNRLYDENIYYVGWATDANANDSDDFLSAGPGGVVINRSTEGNDYAACIAATAEAIYDRYWTLYYERVNKITVGDDITFGNDESVKVNDSATAEWPDGKWYVVYDDNDYLGMSTHPGSEQFISSINDFDFSIPGQYDIYYEYDTSVGADNTAALKNSLIVHRSPVAAFDAVNASGTVTLTDLSFDPDVVAAHNSGGSNGIKASVWNVSEVGGTSVAVTDNKFTAVDGKTYLITLTVTDDDDGTGTATKQIAYATTSTPRPFASFTISNPSIIQGISNTVNLVDNSYEVYGGSLTYTYSIVDSNAAVKASATDASSLPATIDVSTWAAGTYTVRLTVKSGSEVSAPVSKQFTIVDEDAPVLSISGKAGADTVTADSTVHHHEASVKLGTTKTLGSGVTYYYSTDNVNWTPVSDATGKLSWSALNSTMTISNQTAAATYYFKAVSGTGKPSEVKSVSFSYNSLSLGVTFSGNGYTGSDAPSSSQWYGTMTVTAGGVIGENGAAPLKINSITATRDGEELDTQTSSNSSSTGTVPSAVAIKLAETDADVYSGMKIYTVDASTSSWWRLVNGNYVTETAQYTIKVDPAIDTFLESMDGLTESSSFTDLIDAMTGYNALEPLQKDHIELNEIAKKALDDLKSWLAGKSTEIVDGFENMVEDADSLDDYRDLGPYYDSLTEEQLEAIDEDTLAEFEKKLDELKNADTVIAAVEKATDGNNDDYRSIQLAVDSYDVLTDEEKALIPSDVKTKYDKLKDDKAAIDNVVSLIDAAESGALTPELIDAIGDAKSAYDSLSTGQEDVFPADEKAILDALVEKAESADKAQDKIDGLTDGSSFGDIQDAYNSYQALTPDEKKLVDAQNDGSSIKQIYDKALALQDANVKAAADIAAKIEEAYSNPNTTVDDVNNLFADFGSLTQTQKDLIPSDTLDKLTSADGLNYRIVDVENLVDAILDDTGSDYGKKYDLLTPGQKAIVDASTGGLGAAHSAADPVIKDIEDIQNVTSVEELMLDYLALTEQARELIPSDLVDDLNAAYDDLIGNSLDYVNSEVTDETHTQVTVVGLADNVELPASAAASATDPSYSTTVVLNVKDDVPENPPVVEPNMNRILSIDLKLIATVYRHDGQDAIIVEEGEIQPAAGKAIAVLIELPSGYSADKLQIFHVKSNGVTQEIRNFDICVLDGVSYIKLYLADLSHIVIYAERTQSGGGETKSFTITAKASEGGTISPNGASVTSGSSKTFTFTPDKGYIIKDVLIDGVSVGAVKSYTFTNVKEEHSIEVVFEKKDDDSGDADAGLPYYIKGDKKVFIGFASDKFGTMRWLAPEGETVLLAPNPKSFTDISGHYAKSSIDFVTEREVFVGTSANVFAPGSDMTRAMFVTVLGRMHERSFGTLADSGNKQFADVNYQLEYGRYLTWATENELVFGVSDTAFEPNRSITREEMAALIYRYAKFLEMGDVTLDQSLSFSDNAAISTWAEEAVRYNKTLGFVNGYPDGSFKPGNSITRAEVAIILQRFIEYTVDTLYAE